MAGYALSVVGDINVGQPNLILIGAPGFNSDAGTAYLIPGRAGLYRHFLAVQRGVSADLGPSVPALHARLAVGHAQLLRGLGLKPVPGYSRHGRRRLVCRLHHRCAGYDITQNTNGLLAGGAEIVEGGLITRADSTHQYRDDSDRRRHAVCAVLDQCHDSEQPADLRLRLDDDDAQLHARDRHQPRHGRRSMAWRSPTPRSRKTPTPPTT